MSREPVYYPDTPCHMARLRPGQAPEDGCDCAVCRWARARTEIPAIGPIKPGTPEWDALMEIAA